MDNAGRRNIHARAACPEAEPGTMTSAPADRDTRPRDPFLRDFSHRVYDFPNSRTTQPRIRLHAADAKPQCMALQRFARPQPWGESKRIFAAFERIARRRMPSGAHSAPFVADRLLEDSPRSLPRETARTPGPIGGAYPLQRKTVLEPLSGRRHLQSRPDERVQPERQPGGVRCGKQRDIGKTWRCAPSRRGGPQGRTGPRASGNMTPRPGRVPRILPALMAVPHRLPGHEERAR